MREGQEIDLLMSSLSGPDSLIHLFNQFESNLDLFEEFISPSSASRSSFHEVLAKDQLQATCLESYFRIISNLFSKQ